MLPVAQIQTTSSASVFCSLIRVFVLSGVLLLHRNTSVTYHTGKTCGEMTSNERVREDNERPRGWEGGQRGEVA